MPELLPPRPRPATIDGAKQTARTITTAVYLGQAYNAIVAHQAKMNDFRGARQTSAARRRSHVVSELCRRGMVALPTIRNTAAFDIVVTSQNGRKHANIQVKTSGRRRQFWRMPPSSNICCGRNDYYALLRWNPKESRFQVFLLSGKVARDAVAEGEAFQRKRIREGTRKEIVPSIYIGKKRAKWGQQWGRNWFDWIL